MVRPLDQVVRDRIAPVLREAGFTRKGRWFRRENDRGDVASVYVQSSRLGIHDAEFVVNLFVAPRIWHDFTTRNGSSGDPGLWRDRLLVPGMVPPRADHWSFDLTDEAAGRLLSDTLAARLPEFLALLDPHVLLDYARTAPRVSGRRITVHQGMSVAALLASLGPSDELDRLLRDLAQEPGGIIAKAISDFVDFVPTWVATHRPSTQGGCEDQGGRRRRSPAARRVCPCHGMAPQRCGALRRPVSGYANTAGSLMGNRTHAARIRTLGPVGSHPYRSVPGGTWRLTPGRRANASGLEMLQPRE